jgi:streptogramin lyase
MLDLGVRAGWRSAVVSMLAGATLAAAATQAQAATITEFNPGLTNTSYPNHIAAGPDGNLWFIGHNAATIDRMTPTGELTEFFLTPWSCPEGIAAGPDGNLWFGEVCFDRVGRITPGGSVTELSSQGIAGEPEGITAGPDGNLWFTERTGRIGRITPAGVVTEFSSGISGSGLYGIAPGPDGNLWFTEESGQIGRITPAGAVSEFSAGITPASRPRAISAGSDGSMWFTEPGANQIGRITPGGLVSEFSAGISPGSEPFEIARGADGNLWFTEPRSNRIGQITPNGAVSEFSEGITGSEPRGITAGPEGDLWFTEGSGQIGRVIPEANTIAHSAGIPKYNLDAATYFDPFGTLASAPWVKAHISLVRGYPPSSDNYVRYYAPLPVIGYHDPATEGQAPLEQKGIEEYVAKVQHDMSLGYAGVFVDDANWTYSPSPGSQENLAKLLEAIRAAEPGALIEINSQYHDIWPLMKAHDAYVERALRVINVMHKEFGVGPTSAINTNQDYREVMEYVDALHTRGIHVTMAGDYLNNNLPTMEYNEATYFLVNDGSDYVSGVNQTPLSFWPGFEVDLGSPLGPREYLPNGLWTRRFTGGVIYADPPEGTTQTIQLPKRMRSPNLGEVEAVTLAPAQGAVLVG